MLEEVDLPCITSTFPTLTPMNRRCTLQDVALRAHCSKSTVSLALRNDRRIPERTRLKIQRCARELNYRPDPALASIAAHRWQSRTSSSGSVLAFLTTRHPGGFCLDDAALVGARQQAEELGYRLEHFESEDYPHEEHLARVLEHRGIRGIIMGQLMRERFLKRFPWGSFCGVGCNVGFFRPPLHLVTPDHAHAVKRAYSEAYRRGYRRIGMVLFDEPNAIDDFDKVSAYLFCVEQSGVRGEKIPVAHVAPVQERTELIRWYRDHKPDCVLGLNVSIAWWLRQRNVRIPDTTGFVALMATSDEDPEVVRKNATMTRLDHCPELLGRTAVSQLDVLLRTNQMGSPAQPTTMMVEATWQEGASLPIRASSLARDGGDEGRSLESVGVRI